jgi:hypothetical protein
LPGIQIKRKLAENKIFTMGSFGQPVKRVGNKQFFIVRGAVYISAYTVKDGRMICGL